MTSNDVLHLLLAAVENDGHVFDHAETGRWPRATFEQFIAMGLLRQAARGLLAPCPNCAERHVEPVTVSKGPDGRQRFSIWCPESLRTEVQPEMCRGWQVCAEGLAKSVASALGIKATPTAVVPNRLWQLGRIHCSGKWRMVALALRLADPDAESMARQIATDGREIVFVASVAPAVQIWPGRIPPIVPLSHIATLDETGLAVDPVVMAEMVEEADRVAHLAGGIALTEVELKAVIRRLIKTESKTALSDEAIVEAYRYCGTARETERVLRGEGHEIDHSTIARKVKKAKEAGQDVEPYDSDSVKWSVASQPRDRATEFLKRR